MATTVAHYREKEDASAIIRHLDRLVTGGPRDLDVVAAMSAHGFDAVKWAEGQGVLAELVSSDQPVEGLLVVARNWYRDAALAAVSALDKRPQLLAKLGVSGSMVESP
jgi:hypothetical protein